MPVHLYSASSPAGYRLCHHRADAAGVTCGVDHCVPGKPVRVPGYYLPDLHVRGAVVRAERCQQDRPGDPRASGPAQIGAQRGVGVPGPGQPVALTGMAMAVDDHWTTTLALARR